MSAPHRTIPLRACTVRIGRDWSKVEFYDGTSVTATPSYDEESVARARALGYVGGTDKEAVDAMTREHDAIHSLIADEDPDEPYCMVLWGVAHDFPMHEAYAQGKEAEVFRYTAALNGRVEQDADPMILRRIRLALRSDDPGLGPLPVPKPIPK